MRKQYESKADLEYEKFIAGLITEKWSVKMAKLSFHYEVDFAAFSTTGRPALKFYMELKHRDVPVAEYDTIMLSAAKVERARQLAAGAGVPAFFFVAFRDEIRWLNLSTAKGEVFLGGRTDRGDEHDLEPVYHFAIAEMTPFARLTTQEGS